MRSDFCDLSSVYSLNGAIVDVGQQPFQIKLLLVLGTLPVTLFCYLDQIKSLQFTSWWTENGEKNNIVIIFRLDG